MECKHRHDPLIDFFDTEICGKTSFKESIKKKPIMYVVVEAQLTSTNFFSVRYCELEICGTILRITPLSSTDLLRFFILKSEKDDALRPCCQKN
jgi:hypothetical protein